MCAMPTTACIAGQTVPAHTPAPPCVIKEKCAAAVTAIAILVTSPAAVRWERLVQLIRRAALPVMALPDAGQVAQTVNAVRLSLLRSLVLQAQHATVRRLTPTR